MCVATVMRLMRGATATCGDAHIAARLMYVATAKRLGVLGAGRGELMHVATVKRLGVLGAGRGEKKERKREKGEGGKIREDDYE
jgi:hypothetical protein